jgi:multidrug resistance efflux pump
MEGPAPAPPAPAEQSPTDGTGTAPPQRRKLKRATRIALIVILILALVAGGGFATSYFLNARNFVSTDNAQVDGEKIFINAPANGTLLDWSATEGAELRNDQVVGRIEIQGGFARPQMNIRAPGEGTVAVDNAVPGMFVTAGTQLAVAYNLDRIYITARVDETDIKAVYPGQRVDLDIDAFPDARITGRVQEIQGGAAGQFSLFPESNTGGNFQKVTQVIPVKIAVENPNNLDLVPGMNVTVHIHKQSPSAPEASTP